MQSGAARTLAPAEQGHSRGLDSAAKLGQLTGVAAVTLV